MILNDYREQFHRNMMLMSRTANGTLDITASTTKKDSMAVSSTDDAKKLAQENTDLALEFLFENRGRNLRSAENLENLILKTAEIANRGIVKEGFLFRSGEDSVKYPYARIKDIPAIWDWFIKTFCWMLTSRCFEVEEIAAFSEYVINVTGHFFSDGCCKISMLISTFVFMRYDLPCVEYTSREDYYRVTARSTIPTVSELRLFLADADFENFLSYYQSICPGRDGDFCSYYEKQDGGTYVWHLTGFLTGRSCGAFRRNTESFFEKYGGVFTVFDCSALVGTDMEGVDVFRDMKAPGKRFALKNLSIDCLVLFMAAGLEENFDGGDRLPKIDLSNCTIISQGKNGVIYKVSDDTVAKTFKKETDYFDIVRARVSLKNALISGVPAPISLGYAEYNGGIVTLMELIDSKSLIATIASEKDYEGYIIRFAQLVKKLHGIRDEKKLKLFLRNLFGREILAKADRVDRILPEKYRGRARKTIEAAEGPECLVHGDIQPNNILVSGDEMLFIDFDNFSTGKAVYDLGTLYRTLFYNRDEDDPDHDYNVFLKIPMSDCIRIWDIFISEYYKDEQEMLKRKEVTEAKIIGTVLRLAKLMKSGAVPESLHAVTAELEKLIDEVDSAC